MTITAHTLPCKQHPAGRAIEVATGKTIIPAPDDLEVSKVALVSWQKIGPNEYRPVVRIHEQWIRLTQDLPVKLGMGIDYRTLIRLIAAGFISSRRPSPNAIVIDLESWFSHVSATADPEFWDRRECRDGTNLTNRERYLAVI